MLCHAAAAHKPVAGSQRSALPALCALCPLRSRLSRLCAYTQPGSRRPGARGVAGGRRGARRARCAGGRAARPPPAARGRAASSRGGWPPWEGAPGPPLYCCSVTGNSNATSCPLGWDERDVQDWSEARDDEGALARRGAPPPGSRRSPAAPASARALERAGACCLHPPPPIAPQPAHCAAHPPPPAAQPRGRHAAPRRAPAPSASCTRPRTSRSCTLQSCGPWGPAAP